MHDRKDAKPRKPRNHSANQLLTRPVTVETCSGPITIATVEEGAKIKVTLLIPDGLPVFQPPPKALDSGTEVASNAPSV